MDTQVKQRWLEALRSGEYKKARGRLHNTRNGTHCCLGVLDIVAELGSDGVGQLTGTDLRHVGMNYDEQDTLAILNDRSGGWDKVCDYIERNL
jgi:hypothetical protein